ncbi:hypothetical protein D3C79_728120 [compost metagenome]
MPGRIALLQGFQRLRASPRYNANLHTTRVGRLGKLLTHRTDAGLEGGKDTYRAPLPQRFVDHRLIRLEHRDIQLAATRLDGFAKRRTGKQHRMRASIAGVAGQFAKAPLQVVGQLPGAAQVARQRVFQQIAQLGLGPQPGKGFVDRRNGHGRGVDEKNAFGAGHAFSGVQTLLTASQACQG